MRIAISGTHGAGKTSLIDELGARLPDYRIVEEPYYVLEERGYEFSQPPTLDDFQLMLRHSITMTRTRRRDIIFDRCPLDYLAYIDAINGSGSVDLGRWQPAIEIALRSFDLVVFIPLTSEAHALLPSAAYQDLRYAVDDQLREIILEDRLGLCGDVEVMELIGPLRGRADQVMDRLTYTTAPHSVRHQPT